MFDKNLDTSMNSDTPLTTDNSNSSSSTSFRDMMSWLEQDPDQYLSVMSNTHEWGSAIEIKAFVQLHKCNVFVHVPADEQSSPGTLPFRVVEFVYNEGFNTTVLSVPTIHILWTGNHYVPLRLQMTGEK
jgi:hypothetical protein